MVLCFQCIFPCLSCIYQNFLLHTYIYILGSFSAHKSEAKVKMTIVRDRVIQEERSMYWVVLLSVIVRKKEVHMDMCLILNDYRERAV